MTSFTPSNTGISEYREKTKAQITKLLMILLLSFIIADSPPKLINATNIIIKICNTSIKSVALLFWEINRLSLLCSSRDKSSATFFLVSNNL